MFAIEQLVYFLVGSLNSFDVLGNVIFETLFSTRKQTNLNSNANENS